MSDILSEMKSEIADDLARSDLTSVIATAISEAIKFYQSKRFYFNEKSTDDIYFDTVNNQEWYDKYDNKYIPDLMQIDSIVVYITSTTNRHLLYRPPEYFDGIVSTTTSEPVSYTYYAKKLRFYPIPNGSHTIKIAAHVKIDEPATDAELNNPWMTDAELLIKARAKVNVVRKVNAAGLEPTFAKDALLIYQQEEKEALDELKGRSNIQMGSGRIAPY